MKKKYGLSIVSVLVLALFATLALGSGDSEEPVKVDNKAPVEEPKVEEPKIEIFKVGDTVELGGLLITVNGARYDWGSDFSKPEDGERWLAIDCSIENKGSEATTISSLMMFSLQDQEHYKRELNIFGETKGSLDGELGPGRTMRGEIAFVVEEGQTEWEFIFEPNLFDFGQAIYKITAEDVKQ